MSDWQKALSHEVQKQLTPLRAAVEASADSRWREVIERLRAKAAGIPVREG